MLAPELVTAPATHPVSLEEAKRQLRVDYDDDDALIEGYIAAATAHLDGWRGILGRALVTQTWIQAYCGFGALRLPLDPVQSIEHIRYTDRDGNEQTVAATDYVLLTEARGAYVTTAPGKQWPSDVRQQADAVRVRFVAGFGTAAELGAKAAAIRQAMLLLIGHWYEHREAVNVGNIVNPMPKAVDALLAPYRRIKI